MSRRKNPDPRRALQRKRRLARRAAARRWIWHGWWDPSVPPRGGCVYRKHYY